MENLGYLFAAYTLIWVAIFGYILFIHIKQRKLQQQIELLQKATEKPESAND